MLDQSFSAHNFEVLFNLEKRKGHIDIKSMSQPYQDVLSEIKKSDAISGGTTPTFDCHASIS